MARDFTITLGVIRLTDVFFRILGPLEVVVDGQPIAIGRNRQRTVLALLLAHANRTITVDQLVRALWEEDVPRTAVKQVQSCVWRLRALFRSVDGLREVIHTTAAGYCVRVAEEQVDTGVFERLVHDARALATRSDHGGAVELLRTALALFRGPVLAGIDSPALEGVVARWEERRLVTVEERMTAELAAGRHRDVVDELSALVVEHPFREALRSHLMLALYRCGRQADALAAFHDGRESMIGELGLEPGPGLRDLHGAILKGDVAPDPVEAAPVVIASHRVVPTPSQLPPEAPDFVQRPEHTASVLRALAPGDRLRVCGVTGRFGAGKSALAVHAAHLLADRYPDGQLYADMAGARADPADLDAVRRRFLHALGVPHAHVPAETGELAALYRGAVAGRRVLVVLDDVSDPALVEALSPTGPDTGLLLTSRTSLTGLFGVDTVALDALTERQALDLLARVAGPDRADAEPDAALEVVRACALLPLAIRAAGARLAAHPELTMEDLARRLRASDRRIDELGHGDLDPRARLAPDVDRLEHPLRELLLVLGLCCGTDRPIRPVFRARFAAFVGDLPAASAERALDRLVDGHLLDVAALDGRGEAHYRMHPLIGAYAAERALVELPRATQGAVVDRAMAFAIEEVANSSVTRTLTQGAGGEGRQVEFG